MPVPQDSRTGQEMQTSAGGNGVQAMKRASWWIGRGPPKLARFPHPLPPTSLQGDFTSTPCEPSPLVLHRVAIEPHLSWWFSRTLSQTVTGQSWTFLQLSFPPPPAPPYLETNPHPTGLLAPTIDLCLVQQTGVRAQGNSCILKTWTIEICEGSNYLFLCGTVSLGPQTKSGTNREPSKCLEEEWVKQLLPLWLRDIYSPCDSEWQSGEVGLGPEWEGMCSLSATLWVTSGVSIPKGLQGDFRYRDTRKEFLQSWTTWLIW